MVAPHSASPAPSRHDAALRHLDVVASLAFIAMSVFVAKPGSSYRFSARFLVPIAGAPYLLRRRIHLLPLHDLLFALAVLLHNLGAFGYYSAPRSACRSASTSTSTSASPAA